MFLLKLISMQQIQVTMVMNTVKHLQLFGKESTVANLFNEIIYKLMKLIRFDHMVFCTGVCV